MDWSIWEGLEYLGGVGGAGVPGRGWSTWEGLEYLGGVKVYLGGALEYLG